HLQWLVARTLSSIGSTPPLSGGIIGTISRLEEAVQLYRSIGEKREIARPLYFLAGVYGTAASFEDGLRLALESLPATDPMDHFRLIQSYAAISDMLDRM